MTLASCDMIRYDVTWDRTSNVVSFETCFWAVCGLSWWELVGRVSTTESSILELEVRTLVVAEVVLELWLNTGSYRTSVRHYPDDAARTCDLHKLSFGVSACGIKHVCRTCTDTAHKGDR